jgi:serine/threonine protein kinase/Tfp pilus assembly protein PilF
MSIQQGTQLGHYEIRSLIGRGGMGEVYLAHDLKLRRNVAIKILPADVTQNKTRLARFEREAYAASALNHPNILTIHEIDEQNGMHFIASEWIEGESLRQRMSHGSIELREALDIASQTAAALAAAHHAGIVHRDVKPENIMVRKDGFIKVLDFGLAKLANEARETETEETDPEARTRTKVINTEPGIVMGTASYMSPEQARGLEVDGRTDLWSLGVVLYEMVSGRLPFEGATTTDILSMILHREPPSLLLYRSGLPAELERIIEKALAKDKDERYQLAKDLGLDLKRLKQRLELETELERSITPEEEMRRRSLASTSRTEHSHLSAATQAAQVAATSGASAIHTISSAEYVVGELKRHKLAAGITFAVLIAAGIASFAYYGYSKSSRAPAITSVAILPFTNVSGDQNMEYLSDGLSESLINSLSQVGHLKVIARGSVFRYKGKEVDPAEVAQALNVQAIVTGRVVQVGDQLQVSAELVNVQDKTQLWGEQYKRKASDLLAVQAEISQQIAEKLRLRLTNAQEQQLVKAAAANPRAYDLLLKARFFSAKASSENLKKGIDYCNQAIAIDPNYAPAHAELAFAYRTLAANSLIDPKEALPKAEAAVRKALELDDSLAEAHVEFGAIKTNAWDWAGAEREYKRAIELNPNLSLAYNVYSALLTTLGRHEESLVAIKRARELDPLRINVNANVGYRYYFARQYDQAIEHLKSTLEMDRNSFYVHALLGYAYTAKGEFDKAIEEHKIAIQLAGKNTGGQCYLGAALAKAGRRAEAEAILRELKTTKEYVSPGELAVLYLALGDKEGALALLERAYDEHDLQLRYLKIDPHFDSLRSEPRFRALIRKVGLPE